MREPVPQGSVWLGSAAPNWRMIQARTEAHPHEPRILVEFLRDLEKPEPKHIEDLWWELEPDQSLPAFAASMERDHWEYRFDVTWICDSPWHAFKSRLVDAMITSCSFHNLAVSRDTGFRVTLMHWNDHEFQKGYRPHLRFPVSRLKYEVSPSPFGWNCEYTMTYDDARLLYEKSKTQDVFDITSGLI